MSRSCEACRPLRPLLTPWRHWCLEQLAARSAAVRASSSGPATKRASTCWPYDELAAFRARRPGYAATLGPASGSSTEVPRQVVVPAAAVVTTDNVDRYEKYAFS